MDRKYLQQRGATWHFVIAVPKALRGQFKSPSGRPLTRIEKALGTADEHEAKRLRWGLADEWLAKFAAAKRAEVSAYRIEREARKLYDETLAALELDARRRRTPACEEIDSLHHWLGVLHDEIEHPTAGDAAEDVEIIARRVGVPIIAGTPIYAQAREAALWARYKAVQGRIDKLEGKASMAPEVFLRSGASIDPLTLQPMTAAPPRAARADEWTVSHAGAALVREKERIKLSGERISAIATAVRLFADHSVDAPLSSITRQDARAFIERISKLRPTWNRDGKARTMTLDQIERHYGVEQGETGLTSSTVSVAYISPLKSLFDHAADVGAFSGANPFARMKWRPAKGEGRDVRAFTVSEVNRLLAVEPFNMSRAERILAHGLDGARLWTTLLGIYTGARQNELAKLRVADLKQERGIFYLDITGDNGGVKTAGSKRRVPLHPALKALGFVDYVAGLPATGQLLPALKANSKGAYADRISEWFTRTRRTVLGRATDGQLDFHSFRRLLATQLREAGVAEADVAAITGHKHKSETFGTYAKTVSIERLDGIMANLKYDGLRLPA